MRRHGIQAGLAGLCLSVVMGCSSGRSSREPVLCYVGGTMRPAVEQLARLYETRTGEKIAIDYSSSGEALIKARQTGRGDLIVVHDPYLGAILKEGLGDKGWTVATLKGVIAVPKGNPKSIGGLNDLATPGVKLVLSDAVYSTLGHIVEVMAKKSGLKEQLERNLVTRTKGSGEAANAVALGTADAAIVWNAVAWLRRDKLDAVEVEPQFCPVPGVDAVTSATFGQIEMATTRVTVARLVTSKQKDAADRFAEFLASEEAAMVWADQGYSAAPDGEKVVVMEPKAAYGGSILIHCAAGMRLPVERLAREFERNRGVQVALSYDGSNRLLGQIELTGKGDIYISGDADYIEMAREKGLLSDYVTICYFEPVIMVQKGNPKGIMGIGDLGKPGVKLGVGDAKAAAVGRLTPKIFDLNGIVLQAWQKNVVLQTPTVNELGSAIKLGTLDATIVWTAIAVNYPNDADMVKIPPARNIFPAVGAAVLRSTQNEGAAKGFLQFLKGVRGRAVLTECGYAVDKPNTTAAQ